MTQFHDDLKSNMDEYARLIYEVTRSFPKEEIYGITSQLRRAGLSVIVNYIEGYARIKSKVHKNFLEISYGSLKESKYLLFFSEREKYLSKNNYDTLDALAEDIGRMLWGILRKI